MYTLIPGAHSPRVCATRAMIRARSFRLPATCPPFQVFRPDRVVYIIFADFHHPPFCATRPILRATRILLPPVCLPDPALARERRTSQEWPDAHRLAVSAESKV